MLRRQLQVSEIVVEEPSAVYESRPDQVQLIPIKSTAPAPVPQEKASFDRAVAQQKEAAQSSKTQFSQFEIKSIRLKRGNLVYRDRNRKIPFELIVSDIEIDVHQLSLTQLVDFSGSLNLDIAGKKNLKFDGSFSYPEEILKLNANFQDSVKMIAKASDFLKTPELRVDIGINGLDFSTFYTDTQKQGEYLSGLLSGNISLSSHGSNGLDAIRSLSGIGKLRLEQGALKNRNVLREAIQNISQIPGLTVLFQSDLGERFNRLLASPDTAFDQIASNLQVGNMSLGVDFISLIHPDYRINTAGWIGFNKSVELKGTIEIGKELSEAMIHKVKELAYILNPQNEITIPFTYKGVLPQAVLSPNVGNLASRVIQNVGTDFLDQALIQLLKSKQDTAQESSAPTQVQNT